jgi:methylenetetrahydrofolate reductase (NADPH)
MDRMLQNLTPLFTDMTWGAGGSTAELSLALALHAHNTGHVCKFILFCSVSLHLRDNLF